MKKVLIVTYYFPPEGGHTVQRVAKFVKYLKHYDYEPYILSSIHPMLTLDMRLYHDGLPKRNIHLTKDWGAYIPASLRRMFRSHFIPDKHVMWAKTAFKKAVELHTEHHFDLIFTTSPPHSVHLLGLKIKNELGIPWVADFRDEWTFDPEFTSKRETRDLQKEQEKNVLRNVDWITTITNTGANHLKMLAGHRKISIIRNGYDPDDFKHIDVIIHNKKKLNITYSGRLNKTHSPATFFKVLEFLFNSGDVHPMHFELNLIGRIDAKPWKMSFFNLYQRMTFHGYLSHHACLQKNSEADILLLLATKLKESEALPAKFFEYIYIKKPIMAVVDKEGELTELLEEYGNSYIAYDGDVDSAREAVLAMYQDWKDKKLNRPVNTQMIDRFNRKNQTGELAAIFDKLIAQHSGTPDKRLVTQFETSDALIVQHDQ